MLESDDQVGGISRTVYSVGRNGMHRYNNQDHSMMTAMVTAENILHGTAHDVWAVNVEQDYHEENSTSGSTAARGTGRSAPAIPLRASEEREKSRV